MGAAALSRLYENLGRRAGKATSFQQALIDKASRKIAFDGHVIACTSEKNDLSEYGYKAAKLNLPQINWMTAYDVETKSPLANEMFNGSIPDKTSIQQFFDRFSFSDTLFIVDRGFNAADNKQLTAVVVYQDEVHFQVTTSVTHKWVLKGSEPKVKSAPGRKSVPYSGYVIPETGELIISKPSWFNYETVIGSFRHLLENYPVPDGKRIYLILDNAPWHKKAVRLVQTEALPEYQDIRDKMSLLFLPPYFS